MRDNTIDFKTCTMEEWEDWVWEHSDYFADEMAICKDNSDIIFERTFQELLTEQQQEDLERNPLGII